MTEEIHEGGCACGSVRYRTTGAPTKTAACHCRYCQLRTGSAFGVSVYFPEERVELLQGALSEYSFQTESGRGFTTQFCPRCGTTLFWRLGLSEGAVGVAGGTFDPPSFWYEVDREIFTRSKAGFVRLDVAHSLETTASYEPTCEDPAPLRGG
mgnify:CR=1 FL=1